jgi:hypothetical protein
MTKKNRKDNSGVFRKALLDGADDAIENQEEQTKEINISTENNNLAHDDDSTAVIQTEQPNNLQVKSIEDKTALVHWKALSQAMIGGGSTSRRKGETFPFPRYEYEKTAAIQEQAPPIPMESPLTSSALEIASAPAVLPVLVPLAVSGSDSEKTIAVEQNNSNDSNKSGSDKKKQISNLKKSTNIFEKTKTDFRSRSPISVSVNSTEVSLLVEENYRIAQDRILQLENELEKVRSENIELAGHSEVLNIRIDEMKKQISESDRKYKDLEEAHSGEFSLLKSNLEFKMQELDRHKERNKDLEWRLASDLRKVRVRERELENRLEIAKAERNALMKVKDDIILELKHQIETLQLEMENYKLRSTEQHKVIESNQDQFKRVVRALRLALSNLENAEETPKIFKKAE